MPALALSRSQHLHETNRRLRFWLDSLRGQPGQPAALAAPEHMAALLSELLYAGAALRAQPIPAPGRDPELDTELQDYRSQVELLRDLLPSLQRQLLAERSRLEAQRTRLRSAAEWARASRQTL
jgi:hypothetical protein